MPFARFPSLRCVGYGLLGWSCLSLSCTSGGAERSGQRDAGVSGGSASLIERIGDLFTDHITDCGELKAWCADHPSALLATSSSPGLLLRLRQMNALVATCQEVDWSGDLTEPAVESRLPERRRTVQFLLEARYTTDTDRSAATSWLDSLRIGDRTDAWVMVQDGDSSACLMAIPEATGGMVPGMNLLLAFDIEERPTDYEVIYKGHGASLIPVRFAFEGSELQRLNEALPPALRYTINPGKV